MAEFRNDEIIKALECCIKDIGCDNCPLFAKDSCFVVCEKEILDLIKRKDAEIEELRKGFTADADYFASEYDTKIKTEAIKEFAERLTDRISENLNRSSDNLDGDNYFITDVYTDIDNLAKEMTEGGEK